MTIATDNLFEIDPVLTAGKSKQGTPTTTAGLPPLTAEWFAVNTAAERPPPQASQPAPAAATLTAQEQDAITEFRVLITNIFGGPQFVDPAWLDQFATEMWRRFQSGTPEEVLLADLRKSEPWRARFAGIVALQEKGRPINEATYLDIERRMTEVARSHGLPATFYDQPSDFARLIGEEVSPAEYDRRLGAWETYERQTRDPDFEAEVRRQFAAAGVPVSEGYFLAAALDPDRAVAAIERDLSAAGIGTEARRSGFGQIDVAESRRLADLGVNQQAASEGFGALAESRELLSPLAGEAGGESFTQRQQIDAAFGLSEAERRRIERQRRRRMGEFAGGGGIGSGRGGLTALDSA